MHKSLRINEIRPPLVASETVETVFSPACRESLEADPETYEVLADGVHLTCEPTTVLPLARRYFLY